jgi:hypothetical protein
MVMWTGDRALVAAIEGAINEADPLGLLEGGAPSDEYAPEIGTILPRLADAQKPEDVTSVLHEEFVRWFGEDTAGSRDAYQALASRIWAALLESRQNSEDESG